MKCASLKADKTFNLLSPLLPVWMAYDLNKSNLCHTQGPQDSLLDTFTC